MHRRRLTRSGLVIALFGLLVTLLVQAPQAQASSTILCKGFTACEKAGYSSFGYGPSNHKKMWWRMYAGHNCTNYVAYRMIKAGMPSERPWSGSGDARNWGVVFKSKVNQTPTVGSVAWWSSNHVAYVQQVVDADTIIISEDHYRGDFDWRRITRAGGGWPTGFIHLVDEAVTATSPPAVTGTPKVDQALTVKPGAWNRTGATYKFQWLSAGKAVAGATASKFTPTAAQVGTVLSVKVTATKAGYKSGTATSAVTKPTAPGTMAASGPVEVSGIPKVGAELTATLPQAAPAPVAATYAWYADGALIRGATGLTTTLEPAQLGKAITFAVTATRPGYENLRVVSEPTAEVGPEKLAVTREPALVGNPFVGKPFSVVPGAVTPAATTSYQWFGNGEAIRGATRATYTPTSTDPGTRLVLRVTYSRPGYTTIVRELKPRQAVHATARLVVTSTARKTVTVKVVADGVPVVRGEVTLTGRDGSTKTLTLSGGKATFSLKWLYAGTRTYTVSYLGSVKVEAVSRSATVVVK